jgi:hypothetical protein
MLLTRLLSRKLFLHVLGTVFVMITGCTLSAAQKAENMTPEEYRTALMNYLGLAIVNGNVGQARDILNHGAPANITFTQDGSTMLMFAVNSGNEDMVKLLLEYGADPNVRDKEGNTALSLAEEDERKDMADLLLKYGAKQSWSEWIYSKIKKSIT